MWNNNPYEWGYPNVDWLRQEVEGDHKVIIVAHQPPGSVERFEDVNQKMIDLYQHPNVLGSIHGHLHKYSSRLISEKPVVVIDRVDGESYGILKFDENKQISFERCQRHTCQDTH